MTEQDIEDTGKSAVEYEEKRGYKNALKYSVAAVLAIGIGAGVGYFAHEGVSQHNVNKEHQELIESYGEVEALNTTVLETDNGYALGVGSGDNHPASGSFIYANAKNTASTDVTMFLDYSNPRSRDFWFANERFFKGLVESGEIKLTIKPIVSGNLYSAFAAEAQAQIMHRYPEKSWETNTSLLQLNEKFQDSSELEAEQYADTIYEELEQYHNIDDIDTELLTRGDFTHWIYDSVHDERLDENRQTPAVYVNNSMVDSSFHFDTKGLKDIIVSATEKSQE